MPKAKKSPGGDFIKKRGKLGKKKLAPTNATSTEFRARSVVLLDQSVSVDRTGALSQRKLTLGELLTQTRHYSGDVRRDALKGMVELFTRHPAVLLPHTAELLAGVVPMISDEDAGVRRTVLQLFGSVSPRMKPVVDSALGCCTSCRARLIAALGRH
eukprot:6177944-Pleurochrysis_carterae.AAC.3